MADIASQPPIAVRVGEFMSNHWQVLLIALFVGISVSFLVAMIFYHMLNKGVIGNRNVFVLEDAKTPLKGTMVTEVKPTKGMPSNENQMSMSFWIYVEDFKKWNNAFRHVFHRGGAKTDPYYVGPLVYLDASSNKMHVSFRPASETLTDTLTTDELARLDFPNETTAWKKDRKKLEYARTRYGITLDYIPSQRWVHVVITADRRKNMIKAYVDGEEVKTVTGSTPTTMEDPLDTNTKKRKVRLTLGEADLNGTGNVFVGGKVSSNTGVGFLGLVSNMRFFDYVLNTKEVYDEYMRGPIENVMAKMGLPVYGLRSPIYSLSASS